MRLGSILARTTRKTNPAGAHRHRARPKTEHATEHQSPTPLCVPVRALVAACFAVQECTPPWPRVMRRLNSLATGWTAAQGLWRDAAGSKRNLTFDGLMVYVTGRNISAGREWRAPGFARDATATFRFDFSTNGGSARWAGNYSNLEDVLYWQDGSRWTRISQ